MLKRVSDSDFRRMEQELLDRRAWGPWYLQTSNWVLFTEIPYHYEIDLETITDSAQMLDWIFQIASKTWSTAEILGSLVQALQDIFHPQSYLCSWGKDHRINPTQWLEARYRKATGTPASGPSPRCP